MAKARLAIVHQAKPSARCAFKVSKSISNALGFAETHQYMRPKHIEIPFSSGRKVLVYATHHEEIVASGYKVGFVAYEEYPWVLCSYSKRHIDRLHWFLFQAAIADGTRSPRTYSRDDDSAFMPFEVHHRNGNKLDARLHNLEAMSPYHHARLHAKQRRSRPKKKFKLGPGVYMPRTPGPVTHRDDMVGTRERERPLSQKRSELKSIREQLIEVLETDLASLCGRIGDRDSGTFIPPTLSGWRDESTRSLSIYRPRWSPEKYECALVGRWIELGCDESALLESLARATGHSVDVVDTIVRKWLAEVPVRVAMGNWLRYGRLPKAISQRRFPGGPNERLGVQIRRGNDFVQANRPSMERMIRDVKGSSYLAVWLLDRPQDNVIVAYLADRAVRRARDADLIVGTTAWRFLKSEDRSSDRPQNRLRVGGCEWLGDDGNLWVLVSVKTAKRDGRLIVRLKKTQRVKLNSANPGAPPQKR